MKYEIGYQFIPKGMFKYTVTIVDIYKTYNSRGEVVLVEYSGEHILCGKPVRCVYQETYLDNLEEIEGILRKREE